MESPDTTSGNRSTAQSNARKHLRTEETGGGDGGGGDNYTDSSLLWKEKLDFPFGVVPLDPKDPTPPFLKRAGFYHKSLRKEPKPVQIVYTAENPRRTTRFKPSSGFLEQLESQSQKKKNVKKSSKRNVASSSIVAEKALTMASTAKNTSPKSVTCDQCSMIFSDQISLERHKSTHFRARNEQKRKK